MVSRNLSGIASEFEDMVDERDWQGFVALAGLAAVGGVLAEMFQDRISPRLGRAVDPSGTRGLLGSFGVKAAAAVLLGFLMLQVGGDMALVLGVLGVGAAADAGVDLIEAVDSLRGGSAAAPRPAPAQPRRQVQPAQPSGGSTSAANMDDRGRAHPESLLSQV